MLTKRSTTRVAPPIEDLGPRVIRFWNSAVLTNRDGVCATILDACGGEHPFMGPG